MKLIHPLLSQAHVTLPNHSNQTQPFPISFTLDHQSHIHSFKLIVYVFCRFHTISNHTSSYNVRYNYEHMCFAIFKTHNWTICKRSVFIFIVTHNHSANKERTRNSPVIPLSKVYEWIRSEIIKKSKQGLHIKSTLI